MSDSPERPRIAVIGTGGTIGTAARHSLDLFEYPDFGRKLQVEELLSTYPELEAAADLIPVNLAAASSSAIGPPEWLELNRLVHTTARDAAPVDGIVITHGTATLEETAYFLNLTLKLELPVVVVGAQRPVHTLGSDAGSNLLSAIRLAASPAARGLGVLVLLNDEIHPAREVTKTSTLRLETFRAPDLGMLGYVDADGQVALYRSPARRHAPETEFDVRDSVTLPRVDISYSYAGADGTVIRALTAAGAAGIVCASLAPGLVTPEELVAQREARHAGVVVVQSSRAGSGRVLSRTRLREDGIVTADNLNPQKARVLTMLALTRTDEPAELQRMFATY